MPVPTTRVTLPDSLADGGGYLLTEQETGDLAFTVAGSAPGSAWVAAMPDLGGDGRPEIVVGVPGNGDQNPGGGRVYVTSGGTAGSLGDTTSVLRIDGARNDDHVGVAVATIGSMNGDALAEVLVGAPLVDQGLLADAGAAYVVWGSPPPPRWT